jgi:hypothetical protein
MMNIQSARSRNRSLAHGLLMPEVLLIALSFSNALFSQETPTPWGILDAWI